MMEIPGPLLKGFLWVVEVAEHLKELTFGWLQVTPAEAKSLLHGCDDPSPLQMSGIKLGGVKYMFLKNEAGRSAYGRKGGEAECVVVKTNQALVIGVYEGGVQVIFQHRSLTGRL